MITKPVSLTTKPAIAKAIPAVGCFRSDGGPNATKQMPILGRGRGLRNGCGKVALRTFRQLDDVACLSSHQASPAARFLIRDQT